MKISIIACLLALFLGFFVASKMCEKELDKAYKEINKLRYELMEKY